MKDTRPDCYLYYQQLVEHLHTWGDGENSFFDGSFIWPKQLEVHLPGDHISPCSLQCPHCQGKLYEKGLGDWELDGLVLLEKLQGQIPYHIYGGAYTEPLMNPYFMSFIAMTKRYNNHFGIHTNGIALRGLDETTNFLSELNRLATDGEDYLSVSLDAGSPEAWGKVKGTKHREYFHDILNMITKAVKIREQEGKGHAVRVCFLLTELSDNIEDIKYITEWAKLSKIDSLRFSIPYAVYNQDFSIVRDHKNKVETANRNRYAALLEPFVSKNKHKKPYIFYVEPDFTDVDRLIFNQCIYGYFQLTLGADGYYYKCSAVAAPTAKQCRVGKVTDDIEDLKTAILTNYNPDWNCQKMCFEKGLRCNRMGNEINNIYYNLKDSNV